VLGSASRYGARRVSRHPIIVLIAVLAASAVFVGAATAMGAAGASMESESSNPINDQGSSFKYRSTITSVTPDVSGLTFQVLQFADRLLMVNHTHQTVTVYGYDGEPYARVLADGTAEQNARSPATYLNKSFYGDINVPPQANPKAAPQWEVIDRTGQLEWHDHRIHYTSPAVPPQVKDRSKRTLVFDWSIPIAVGARKGAIAGQLFWTPETSKASTTVIVIGVAIVLLGLAFVVVVRMRRRRTRLEHPPGDEPPAKEAW
jgi:hypothetical protein